MMRRLLVLLTSLIAVMADPPDVSDDAGSVHHRPLLRSTTLGDEAGTPDPSVSEDVRKLLEDTDYTDEDIQYMPQTVKNPNCFVKTYVIKEQRHGGKCSKMMGGLPFCGVKNYVYPNHPDCVNTDEAPASEAGGWGSSRWGPFYSQGTNIDPPTESTDDEDDSSSSTSITSSETATENPRFKRQAQDES